MLSLEDNYTHYKVIAAKTAEEMDRLIEARTFAYDELPEMPPSPIFTEETPLDQDVIVRLIKIANKESNNILLMISSVRILMMNDIANNQILDQYHLMELQEFQQSNNKLYLQFRIGGDLSFEFDNKYLPQTFVQRIWENYAFHNPGFRGELACKWLDQFRTSQEDELEAKYPTKSDTVDPFDRSSQAFKSWAYYYKGASKVELLSGLKCEFAGPFGFISSQEKWFHTKGLCCFNQKAIYGALLCIAFGLSDIDGVVMNDLVCNNDLYYAVKCLLDYHTTLKSLIVDGCTGGEQWLQLMIYLHREKQNCALKRFGLKNAKCGDEVVKYWIDGNQKLESHPTCVYLTKSCAAPETIVEFIKSLPGAGGGSAGGGTGGLEELDISENPLDSMGTAMLSDRLVKDFHNLTMLNVTNCNVDCQVLFMAIKQSLKRGNCNLKSLILNDNTMTNTSARLLLEILSTNTNFTQLGISNTGIKDSLTVRCVENLMYKKPNDALFVIDISQNTLKSDCISLLIKIISQHTQISSLNIKDCGINPIDFHLISAALQKHNKLQSLEYTTTNIISTEIEEVKTEHIASDMPCGDEHDKMVREWLDDDQHDLLDDIIDNVEAPKQSKKVCRFFNSPQGCKNGEECNFKHVQKICKYWKVGKCTRSNCEYRHQYLI